MGTHFIHVNCVYYSVHHEKYMWKSLAPAKDLDHYKENINNQYKNKKRQIPK